MAEMVQIRVFVCEGCGTRMTWPRREMPPVESGVHHGRCRGCGEKHPAWVRPARIAAADLRYLKRFGRDPFGSDEPAVVVVTDFTE